MEDVEFDLLGLVGRAAGIGVVETERPAVALLILGVEAFVGVGTGDGWAEFETDIASEG